MSRSAVGLREAVPDDLDFLSTLWADSLRRVGPEEQQADVRALLRRAGGAAEERVVVALLGGERVGAVVLRLAPMSPVNPEPVVQVLMAEVVAGCRRRGAGQALVEAAVAFAEERGVAQVAAAAVAGSREANRFMARLGFGPWASYRVAPTSRVRSRITAQQPVRAGGARPVGRVLAVRRSMRRAGDAPPQVGASGPS